MKYIILAIGRGTGKKPVFWRSGCAGFTEYPFAAGQYSEAEVKGNPDYFNDGLSTVAIPLTDNALETLGFKCSYNERSLVNFIQKVKQ